MDKKKKKEKKKKEKKKSKPASSVKDPGDYAIESLLVPGDSTATHGPPESENGGFPPREMPLDNVREETGNGSTAECHPSAQEEAVLSPLSFEDVVCNRADGLDWSTVDGGNGKENGNYSPGACAVGSESEQAVTFLAGKTEALVVEKQLVVELQEVEEALTLERDTSDLLREQLTYLQGRIAKLESCEVGVRAEIERLRAQNIELQSTVGTRGEMQRLNVEIKRFIAENEQLMAENLGTQSKLEQLTTDMKKLGATNEVYHSMIGTTQAELLRLTTENEELRSLVHQTLLEMSKFSVDDMSMNGEIELLKSENGALQSVVVHAEEEEKRLEEEIRNMTTKMIVLQNAIRQLEQSVSVRAHVGEDLAAATTHSIKRWEGWTVKDPLAIAAAVAEESRLQSLANAQVVEKLVGENNELVTKVNEQAAAINDLTLQCKALALPMSFEDGLIDPNFKTGSMNATKCAKGAQTREILDEVSYHKGQVVPRGVEQSQATDDYLLVKPLDLPIKDADIDTPLLRCLNSPIKNADIDAALLVKPLDHPYFTPSVEQEIVPFETNRVAPEPSLKLQAKQNQAIHAPFRWISFAASYISGSDLVRN